MKNFFKKVYDGLKFIFKAENLRKWWYVLLLGASSVYVYLNRTTILDFSTIDAQDLVFFFWIILLVLPLFSEIEILGVKLKKELAQTVQEVKEGVTELRLQAISIKTASSSVAATTATQSTNFYMLGTDQLQELADKTGVNAQRGQALTVDTDLYEKSVPEAIRFLFAVRYNIERKLTSICQHYHIDRQFHGIPDMLRSLKNKDAFDSDTVELLMQVSNIANRGIHGEAVSNEYLSFIHEYYQNIQVKLDEVIARTKSN